MPHNKIWKNINYKGWKQSFSTLQAIFWNAKYFQKLVSCILSSLHMNELRKSSEIYVFFLVQYRYALQWQNQQNDCAQQRLRSAWASAQSDQSLCRPHEESLGPYLPNKQRTAKTLIRLWGCPGWSKSSLGAPSLCWFCHEGAHIQKQNTALHMAVTT